MATCRALALRGHDVTLIVRPDTAVPARDPFAFYGVPKPERMTITTIGSAPGPQLRRLRFLVESMAASAGAGRVVFTRDLGLAAWLLRAPLPSRTRVVYESHGVADVVSREMPVLLGRPELVPTDAKLRRLARREATVWRRAAAYVTITRALADELSSRFGARAHVYVVPDGAAPVAASPARSDARPLIGYAGHLYPWKGVDVLVEALTRLPDAEAIIVGGHPAEGDLTRLGRLASSLGLAERITLTGQVPPAEVSTQLAGARILVLPNTRTAISERYTSPLKLFEYLAMGRAIVASDLPAIREVLTHGDNALLVPPGDADALASAIRRLLDDAGLARQLGERARALAARYTWEARAERLEAALRVAAA